MAPARSHQDGGSDAPQSGTLSASPTAAATVAGDSMTNGGHGRENENGNGNGNGNAEGQRGAGAGAGDIAQAMAPARSHQDEGSDAPQSGTLSASPTAAATVAGDSTTNGGHGRGNENGNADGRGGAGAGAGDIAQAYKDLTRTPIACPILNPFFRIRRGLGQLHFRHGKLQFATGLDAPEMAFAHAKLQFAFSASWGLRDGHSVFSHVVGLDVHTAPRVGCDLGPPWTCKPLCLEGEQAATALEANLAKLESRLDELLAGFETDELRNASSGGKGPAEK
ncbi:hypothetical protein BN1723_002454 [Verticillium longisporum]|uniref:Uncharacterized protein n=1 Tax=Verticillium longisporum TaxID=100787 RepID=A0A0G4L8H0_VERLO|nr:hypothetical protein BN1723_002454 [Verticillium longisporum]